MTFEYSDSCDWHLGYEGCPSPHHICTVLINVSRFSDEEFCEWPAEVCSHRPDLFFCSLRVPMLASAIVPHLLRFLSKAGHDLFPVLHGRLCASAGFTLDHNLGLKAYAVVVDPEWCGLIKAFIVKVVDRVLITPFYFA